MVNGIEKAKLMAQKQKIEKIKLHLNVTNIHKGGRGIKRAVNSIKTLLLPHFDPAFRNLGHYDKNGHELVFACYDLAVKDFEKTIKQKEKRGYTPFV